MAEALSQFAMIHSYDQWRRVSFHNAALSEDGQDHAVVQLAWQLDQRADATGSLEEPCLEKCLPHAGLAFDPWCRLYRIDHPKGQILRSLWTAEFGDKGAAEALFTVPQTARGDFAAASDQQAFNDIADIAIDNQGHLFVADAAVAKVYVFDLWQNRLLRTLRFDASPTRMFAQGEDVWLVFADSGQLALCRARGDIRWQALPEGIAQVSAVAMNGEHRLLLSAGGTAEARVISLDGSQEFAIPHASDLLLNDDKVLAVARRQEEDIRRFQIKAGSLIELPHLKAPKYQGTGIVLTPNGHIAYWTESGLRQATLARLRYKTEGRVVGFQLDSGAYQNQWGRLFIDACIPRGTNIHARCLVLDAIPDTATPLERSPPENITGTELPYSELSPPMPAATLLDNVQEPEQAFHPRQLGGELPWQQNSDDAFRTYEAPIIAPPGRYLWVELRLQGSARLTPRIKSLRAEYPSHDLLRRLPQVYSRDATAADFLRRYLAMPEGELRDIDLRASYRHLLLQAQATPSELLPWLGSFMGLVVDQRWPEAARRELVEHCSWLFRFRGTLMGLKRFLDIYLDAEVILIEHFKVRGLGGSIVGNDDALAANSVLGAGFRIGGQLGQEESQSINDVSLRQAIDSHAHRFSVIIPRSLDSEQLAVVEHILAQHRPAHTLFDICTVEAGMRAGLGLHLGLNSLVGHSSGFGQLQVGTATLGRDKLLGRAARGTHIGSSRLGHDAYTGY